MSTEKRQLSEVVPLLVAALVCDVAVADPNTGKKNLIGVFDKILVAKLPAKREVCVYFKLADADGHYDIQIKFVQVATGSTLVEAKIAMQAKNRLDTGDLYVQFPALPIPEFGKYEFQVWANSMFLGSAVLEAIPMNKGS